MDNGSAGDGSRKKVGKIVKFWRIRIHYESIIHYVSVYPSIIHHVSLSIILSRLRIHSHGPPALLLFVVCLLFVCCLFIVCCLFVGPILALGPFWHWAHFGPGPKLWPWAISLLLAIGYWLFRPWRNNCCLEWSLCWPSHCALRFELLRGSA